MYRVFRIIYGLATLVASAAALAASPKSVSELETSLVFDPKDPHQHLKFLRAIRSVLDRLQAALRPQTPRTRDAPHSTLAVFVQDLLKRLSKFPEDVLQLFFTKLEKGMREHFYKGAVFREIVYDPKLQTYIRYKLVEWTNADPSAMKAKLGKYSGDVDKDTTLNRLRAFLSDYFDDKDEIKMKRIVNKLRATNLQRVIKEALDYFVFEKYDKMNYTSRAKLASEINKLSETVGSKSVDKDLRSGSIQTVVSLKRRQLSLQ